MYFIAPTKIAYKLIIKIKSKNISFTNLIRNYINKLISPRDNILNSINVDINDILNHNITEPQIKKLHNIILGEIKQLSYIRLLK